ncbi:MAG: DoxX family protein [Bacteriovoracia bacterium]
MDTTIHSRHDYMSTHREHAKANLWLVPIGRFLYSIMFVLSGMSHFSSASIDYAASQGLPFAGILVPVSGIIAILGGLSVMLGFHARTGGLLLLLFLIPVTLIMHDFWTITDPQMAQNQFAHFMKNISMIGAGVLIVFYGAGPVSIDNHKAKKGSRT